MATTTLLTVEEFAALPEDGRMHELVEGELLTMPPPHFLHAQIVSILLESLITFLSKTRLGRAYPEGGVLLFQDPPTVRQPDLSVILGANVPTAAVEGYFHGAPEIVFEVVSPSDPAEDLELKVRQYLRAGAKLVAVVYPRARTVWLHRPHGSPQLLTSERILEASELLPGWSLPVEEIFRPLRDAGR